MRTWIIFTVMDRLAVVVAVNLAQLVLPVRMVLLDRLGSKGLRVSLVLRALQVPPEQQENRAPKVPQVPPVQQESKAPKAPQVPLEQPESKAPKVPQVPPEQPGSRVPRVPQVPPEQRGSRVPRAL